MHCGDRAREFTNCVTLYRWSHRVLIEDNRFHDCLGCDFVHGRFGTHLTIRRNPFDRSLPCRMSAHRCGHQDLVQLFAGRHLLVVGNRFGVYKDGGAQLYLTNNVDYATIVNNFFAATDPRVPGYRVRMGIVIGSNASRRLPYYAKLVNNTILSGAVRRDGYAGSIRMSSRYGGVPRWKRPIVANNVIALLETPARVCNGSQRFIHNVVIQGKGCSESDRSAARPGRARVAAADVDRDRRRQPPLRAGATPPDGRGRPGHRRVRVPGLGCDRLARQGDAEALRAPSAGVHGRAQRPGEGAEAGRPGARGGGRRPGEAERRRSRVERARARDPSEVRALIQSGKRLRQAQEAAVAGKKGADLTAAIGSTAPRSTASSATCAGAS